MAERIVTAFFSGNCPECGGGHTVHENNACGHSVSCSLKPETILCKYREALETIADDDRYGFAAQTVARRALASTRTHYDSRRSDDDR